MLVYSDTGQPVTEDKYWYHFRPQETIQELNKLIKTEQNGLEDGITMSNDTYLKVFHSIHDPNTNSLSAVLIYKGLSHANGSIVDVQIMNSGIHVFTRFKLRLSVSALDLINQKDAFQQIAAKLK